MYCNRIISSPHSHSPSHHYLNLKAAFLYTFCSQNSILANPAIAICAININQKHFHFKCVPFIVCVFFLADSSLQNAFTITIIQLSICQLTLVIYSISTYTSGLLCLRGSYCNSIQPKIISFLRDNTDISSEEGVRASDRDCHQQGTNNSL